MPCPNFEFGRLPHSRQIRTKGGGALIVCRSAKRAQAELHHESVIYRYAAAVGVISNVIQGQDEAIIDVPNAHLSLAQRVSAHVVPRCPEQYPVRVQLQT